MKETSTILDQGGLTKVTPSMWLALRQCAFQVLLRRYYHNVPLLPTHPNAILGSILHAALEKITKGELKNKEAFNLWWDAAIDKTEQELISKGWGQFVPLKENARDFGLKKIQVRNRLQSVHDVYNTSTDTSSKVAEKKIISKDGLLGGQLDCIIWQNGQAVIRDYKTGEITTFEEDKETAKIKEEYELQMKLYACLFHDQYGFFPIKLVLEDLNGVEHQVHFNASECSQLMDEVRSTIYEVNEKINNRELESLAKPGEHCSHCQNRPACKKYLMSLETTSFTQKNGKFDLVGTLTGCDGNLNGYTLTLERGCVTYTIACFNFFNLSDISTMINQNVAIFNLRTIGPQRFACSKSSKIYAI
jgi:PD-(D/E)XK nuclease superfamily